MGYFVDGIWIETEESMANHIFVSCDHDFNCPNYDKCHWGAAYSLGELGCNRPKEEHC